MHKICRTEGITVRILILGEDAPATAGLVSACRSAIDDVNLFPVVVVHTASDACRALRQGDVLVFVVAMKDNAAIDLVTMAAGQLATPGGKLDKIIMVDYPHGYELSGLIHQLSISDSYDRLIGHVAMSVAYSQRVIEESS